MESNHDQGGGDDEQGASHPVTPPKSYECNFCKRGFSNAQALGGHMNIHRKDKAKLKQQSSNQTTQLPSLEIHHHHHQRNPEEEVQNKLPNLNLMNVYHHQQDQVLHMRQQLPLFAESPISTSEAQKLPQGQVQGEVQVVTEGSSSELDLELRLGPHEPQYSSSSSATGTRKFF